MFLGVSLHVDSLLHKGVAIFILDNRIHHALTRRGVISVLLVGNRHFLMLMGYLLAVNDQQVNNNNPKEIVFALNTRRFGNKVAENRQGRNR